MNVLVTTQVFPPEIHPTAVMVDQFARYLAKRGHDVTVACGHPHHPTGTLPPGWRRPLLARTDRDGLRVVRGWHVVSPSRSIVVRAAVWVSQGVATALAALAGPRPAVVLNYGPPLVGPLLAALLARARGARLVTVIYDIYPDVAVESGRVKNRAIIALARRVERAVYRASERIIVLSEGFRRTLEGRGVPRERVAVIPVWLEEEEIRPLPRETAWRAEHGIAPDQQVVLYAGTVGLVSGAGVVLDVAERFRGRPKVVFLFVGDGQLRSRLQADAHRRTLDNVRFLPFQPRERLPEVQASSDVSLVTLEAGRGRTSVPSKVIGYMAAGRPVLASVDLDCDTAEAVRSAGCGLVTAPGDADALAAGLERLLGDEAGRREAGARAREAFERTYRAEAVMASYASVLESLAASRIT